MSPDWHSITSPTIMRIIDDRTDVAITSPELSSLELRESSHQSPNTTRYHPPNFLRVRILKTFTIFAATAWLLVTSSLAAPYALEVRQVGAVKSFSCQGRWIHADASKDCYACSNYACTTNDQCFGYRCGDCDTSRNVCGPPPEGPECPR